MVCYILGWRFIQLWLPHFNVDIDKLQLSTEHQDIRGKEKLEQKFRLEEKPMTWYMIVLSNI